jgi:hypothetical protein
LIIIGQLQEDMSLDFSTSVLGNVVNTTNKYAYSFQQKIFLQQNILSGIIINCHSINK